MPKRKRTSISEGAVAVDGARKDEEAEQLPAAGEEPEAEAAMVEVTLGAATAGGEPAIKKARAEEAHGPPSPVSPPEQQPEWGSFDVLAAVFEWVDSTADLVRLSCVSRTWRQLVARDGLWRRRFLAERGQAAHDALALALDLHGPATLGSFLAQARRPPAPDSASTTNGVEQHDEASDSVKVGGSGAETETETEEGGHGLGVWFEAFVSTDEKMWWRRWLATLERLGPAQGMPWMARLVRAAKYRTDLERRVVEWLDAADDDADVTGHNQGAGGDADNGKKSDSDHDNDDDGSKAYNLKTGRLKAPQLKNVLQKKQVRALLHMMRVIDSYDIDMQHRDDSGLFRGDFWGSINGVLVKFLNQGCLYGKFETASDSECAVETFKVFFIDPSEKDHPPTEELRHYTPTPGRGRGLGSPCAYKTWAYSVNTELGFGSPTIDPRHLPEFFDRLRLKLLVGCGKSQAENEKEESLSLEQFLYFVGLVLDLGDKDEFETGYSPLQTLISRSRTAAGWTKGH